MSSPYTSQDISGYNASPPSDDGAETSANTVKWATHKDKLADPIKALVEAIDTELVSAFGKVFGASISAQTTYSVLVTDVGKVLTVTSGSTITLPAVADAGNGFPLGIVNIGTGKVTIDGNGSETINGLTTIALHPGDGVVLTCDGSLWAAVGSYVITDSFTPNYLSGFSSDPAGDINYIQRGSMVTIALPNASGVSNNVSFQIDNLPSAIRPSTNQTMPALWLEDAGVAVIASLKITTAGIMDFLANGINNNWTPSGQKGFAPPTLTNPNFSYRIREL